MRQYRLHYAHLKQTQKLIINYHGGCDNPQLEGYLSS